MAPDGNRRATVITRTAYGTVTLRPDRVRTQCWEPLVDGVPPSYVELGDATFADFGAAVVHPEAVPLRVLHGGGGG